MTKRRVAILISGRGSNMSALIEAARDPGYPAEIALVLSNKADAGGLKHAQDLGIATAVVSHRDFADKRSFEEAIDQCLRDASIDLVCLAGFMRLLSPWFVDAWHDRTLNIHPSLLPSFKGLDTHARALEAGVRVHGCTVHIVRAEMDNGPIIAQAALAVAATDTPESLSARVLIAEHQLYPQALALMASGKGRVVGERVETDASVAVNPTLLLA